MKVSENIQHINENIQRACERSGRRMEDVHVVAVTKYVSIDRAEEAVEAGLLHLGENRDEGLISKWDVLRDKARWHFIGSLQSRKVKNIIDKVSYIHSLDRLSLAKEIHKRADKPVSCFVQVNVSGEGSKHGISPDEVKEFVGSLKDLSNIKVVGLMTMAPQTDDEPFLRSCFRQLKTIQEEVRSLNLPYAPCTELSMGMSNDYVIAIEEGATFIRIGTALVGND
ncbi:YggS family pyridoxal phosphate-dependent enzyme [Rossellomorea vietnamensis]|uniref:YggS family pyridoxal phosphate-dependent enzyme n=1 Tax=Rossellomorea vietnamensis TaxID=218284 RepID=A0ACD4CAN8_9BACI|nr:YggS family pyridoxal phosphate-dependent enzyme [Rossellomorea vietnamensis]UXH45489.1 YggS family pyridoxal phosphate-dependent enzyme [Rossellomorea vietnamensis]WQI96852.1 YggS family pyridoxal phosphate-dependent enzyme [Rossellomorea vietnamensis]